MNKPTKKQLVTLLENAYKIISGGDEKPELNQESGDWVKEYNKVLNRVVPAGNETVVE